MMKNSVDKNTFCEECMCYDCYLCCLRDRAPYSCENCIECEYCISDKKYKNLNY